jgi:outer membrane protein OmpA-like peptidoglycan-associated protein
MSARKFLFTAVLAGLLGGCAAHRPSHMVETERAYQEAISGPAGQVSHDELGEAKKVIDMSNQEFRKYGNAPWLKDRSYVAMRKIETAEEKARAVEAHLLGIRATQARQALLTAQSGAQECPQEPQSSQQEQPPEQQPTAEEQQPSGAPVAEPAQTGSSRPAVISIRDTGNGLVISVSSFETGGDQLSSVGKAAVDKISDQIKSTLTPDQTITVIGYTDNTGSDEINLPLSERRASAVRDELVTQGIPTDQIRVEGRGAENPVVDNDSATNRATNRRVEIQVPKTAPSVSER